MVDEVGIGGGRGGGGGHGGREIVVDAGADTHAGADAAVGRTFLL